MKEKKRTAHENAQLDGFLCGVNMLGVAEVHKNMVLNTETTDPFLFGGKMCTCWVFFFFFFFMLNFLNFFSQKKTPL